MKALHTRIGKLENDVGGGVVCVFLARGETLARALKRMGIDTGSQTIEAGATCATIGRTVYVGVSEVDLAIGVGPEVSQ